MHWHAPDSGMSCQLLGCPPLPHAICSKPAATLTGLSYVVPCKRTPVKFTGPSEVLIIIQSHLSCVVQTPVCHVVRNKVREQAEPVRLLSECHPLAGRLSRSASSLTLASLSTCIARTNPITWLRSRCRN